MRPNRFAFASVLAATTTAIVFLACSSDRVPIYVSGDADVSGDTDAPDAPAHLPPDYDAGRDADADARAPYVDPGEDKVECGDAEPCATAIAAGGSTICALLSDGTVQCWGGMNAHGELGTAVPVSSEPYNKPVPIGAITHATQVSVGGMVLWRSFPTVCARLDDGKIACWGGNQWGQLGLSPITDAGVSDAGVVSDMGGASDTEEHRTPTIVQHIPPANRVDVGPFAACATSADGKVSCWGSDRGATGRVLRSGPSPIRPPGPADFGGRTVAQIGFGEGLGEGGEIDENKDARFALRTTHELMSWGSDENGGLGRIVSEQFDPVPKNLPELYAVSQFSAGANRTCAVQFGDVYCWGSNSTGSLGTGQLQTFSRVSPARVHLPTGSVARGVNARSRGHGCAWLEDGSVYCWGLNDCGQLGNGTREDAPVPVPVQGLAGPVIGIAISSAWDGTLNEWGEPTDGTTTTTCALIKSGVVQCWGDNSNGQLGIGSSDPILRMAPSTPVVFSKTSKP